MRRIIPSITAPLLFAISASAQDRVLLAPVVQNPASPHSADASSAKESNTTERRFNLKFLGGGGIYDFVAHLNKEREKPINVIVSADAEMFVIPPFEVYQTTLPSLFAAVSAASNGKFIFQTKDDPNHPDAIWTFIPGTNALPPRDVKYFPIGELLSRFTVEDITTLIRSGWSMLPRENLTDTHSVRFHEETKLLICSGTPQQLASVPVILEKLKETPSAGAEKFQLKAKRIIIPRLEFREATIREALEFLKRKTIELDDPNDPNRGLNIVLNDASLRADERISISLSNISVLEAMKLVAELANLKLEFRDEVLVIKTQPPQQQSGTGPAPTGEQPVQSTQKVPAIPGA